MKSFVSTLFLISTLFIEVSCHFKAQPTQVFEQTPTTPATVTVAVMVSPISSSVATIQTVEPTATLYPFDKFLQSDVCDLPCWLGITPGSSKWYDIEHSLFLLNYRVVTLDISASENIYGAVLERDAVRHDLEIFTIKDVAQSMHIRIEDTEYEPGNFNWDDPDETWRQFEPGQLIRRYGKPDRTLIAADYEFANRGSSWLLGGLFLIFEKQRFIVQYSFHMSLHTQQFCPTFSHPVTPGYDVEYYDPTSLIPRFDIYMTDGKLKNDLYKLLPVKSFTSAGFTLFKERTGNHELGNTVIGESKSLLYNTAGATNSGSNALISDYHPNWIILFFRGASIAEFFLTIRIGGAGIYEKEITGTGATAVTKVTKY